MNSRFNFWLAHFTASLLLGQLTADDAACLSYAFWHDEINENEELLLHDLFFPYI